MNETERSHAGDDDRAAAEVPDVELVFDADAEIAEFEIYVPTTEELRNTRLGAILTAACALPLLSRVEEYWLAIKAALGDTHAREKLVRHHTRFVLWVARRYEGCGLPIQDLLQEGMLGFAEAVGRFEPWRGYKLITYGYWWVRHHLQRALQDTGHTIRIPVHAHEKFVRLRRARAHAYARGEDATDEDLARMTGDDPRFAHRVRRIGEILKTVSLDDPFPTNEEITWGEVVAAREPDTDTVALTHPELLARPETLFLFSRMPSRYREILFLYFLGWPERAMGERFGISSERVRQQLVVAANYASHRARIRTRRELGADEVSYLCQALVVAVSAGAGERLTKSKTYREWVGRIEGLPAPGVVETLCRKQWITREDEALMGAYRRGGERAAVKTLGRKNVLHAVRQRVLHLSWLWNQFRLGYRPGAIVDIHQFDPQRIQGPPTSLYEILGETRNASHVGWFTEHRGDHHLDIEAAERNARAALAGTRWEKAILQIAEAHEVPLYMLMGRYRHGGVTQARRKAACMLVGEYGLNQRDAAHILGVSPGSMKWLLPPKERRSTRDRAAVAKIA